ncbi:hypothetical protein, partial [Spiribacter roseus]|uniref:hypothetical protein n=1 Tax=Spiribacter roseus TaxID=1855875 RepID=UPI00132F5F6E
GTDGDDTFIAPSETLDVSVVNGEAGTDTLQATLKDADNNAVVTSESVEIFNLRDTDAANNPAIALDLTDASGVEQVWNDRSVDASVMTVSGLSTDVTVGIRKTASDYTVEFDGVTAGSADSATLVVEESEDGSTFTAADVETLSVQTAGSAASTVDLSGNDFTTLNVSGEQDLSAGTLDAEATTVDASGFS